MTEPAAPRLADVGLVPADALPFSPTQTQALAKVRLHNKLAERQGLTSVESLTLPQLVAWSGDRRVERWLRDPEFAAWLFDRDSTAHQIQALKDLAVATLEDVLTSEYLPKVLTAKDKLKAADMLLQLTGSYPSRTNARYLDRDLDEMPEAQVLAEIEKAKTLLGKGKE